MHDDELAKEKRTIELRKESSIVKEGFLNAGNV